MKGDEGLSHNSKELKENKMEKTNQLSVTRERKREQDMGDSLFYSMKLKMIKVR